MDLSVLNEELAATFKNKGIEIKSINSVPYFCVPVSNTNEGQFSVPEYVEGANYSEESKKLKKLNSELTGEIDKLYIDIAELKDKTSELETNLGQERSKKYVAKGKRERRKAAEIRKIFKCDICQKQYGSEGSLNHHTKLKHPIEFKEIYIQRSLLNSEGK